MFVIGCVVCSDDGEGLCELMGENEDDRKSGRGYTNGEIDNLPLGCIVEQLSLFHYSRGPRQDPVMVC